MLKCLKNDSRYNVRKHYVQHRMDLGKPYDGTKSGSLNLNPKFKDTDFIALSLGGNDFALRRETDVSAIIKLVQKVIQFYMS